MDQTIVIDWALKCSIVFSMLYDHLVEEVYSQLYAQMFKHQATSIWATSIRGMFELIERYGLERFYEKDGTGERTSTVTNDSIDQYTVVTKRSGKKLVLILLGMYLYRFSGRFYESVKRYIQGLRTTRDPYIDYRRVLSIGIEWQR